MKYKQPEIRCAAHHLIRIRFLTNSKRAWRAVAIGPDNDTYGFCLFVKIKIMHGYQMRLQEIVDHLFFLEGENKGKFPLKITHAPNL